MSSPTTLLPTTLDALIDIVNDAEFYEKRLGKARSIEIGDKIATRQGGEWAYGGSFELTEAGRKKGILVFTGERIQSASARHIIGEECCRALLKLPHVSAKAQGALKRAAQALKESVIVRADEAGHPGVYCCGKCSVSLWRHLAAGGFDGQERRLVDSMRYLRKHRTQDGQWRGMPFFYTVLALTEIGTPEALRELRYAAPVIERRLRRKAGTSTTSQRRQALMQRAMAMAG
jgi:hypothetical protein